MRLTMRQTLTHIDISDYIHLCLSSIVDNICLKCCRKHMVVREAPSSFQLDYHLIAIVSTLSARHVQRYNALAQFDINYCENTIYKKTYAVNICLNSIDMY